MQYIDIDRFLLKPSSEIDSRWADLSRFLAANRPTLGERLRFVRSDVLNPRRFSRSQVFAFGLLFGSGAPLLMLLVFLAAAEVARATDFSSLALLWSTQLSVADILHVLWPR